MNNKLLSHSNTITPPTPQKKKSGKMKTFLAATMALGAATFAGIGIGEKHSHSSQDTEKDDEAKITYVQQTSNDSIDNAFVENKNATRFLNACPWCAHIPENSPLWNLDNLPDDATWNKLSDSQKKEFLVYANIVSATLFSAGRDAHGAELLDGELGSGSATKFGIKNGIQSCTEMALNLLKGNHARYESPMYQDDLNEANGLIYRGQLWEKVGHALESAEGSVLGSYEATMRMKRMEIEKFLEGKNAKMGGIESHDLLKIDGWVDQMLPTPKTIDFPSVIKNAHKTAGNNVAFNKAVMNKTQKGG